MCLPAKWVTFYNKRTLGDVVNLSGRNVCDLKLLDWNVMAFPVRITDTENLVIVQKLFYKSDLYKW